MKQQQIDAIVEQMTKAKSPYFSEDRIWDKAAKAQAELMINGGFRQVPSVEELYTCPVSIGNVEELHRWLLEKA
uniref:Uncharacterized protein n=1 Tax=viral metagenome TaxID=1070528 RepID=A0A6M3XU05_9ZZZZ